MFKILSTEQKIFSFVLFIKIAVAAVVLVIFGIDKFLWGDSHVYYNLAKDIFLGYGYSDPVRTPLYPFLLSMFLRVSAHGILFMVFTQLLVAAASAVVLYRISLFFLSRRCAVLTALLFALEPLLAIFNIIIFPETFLVFFLLLFIYLFLKFLDTNHNKFLLWSVIFLSCAIWTKPVAAYLFIVPLLFLFWRENYLKAAIMLLVLFLFLFPWMIHNKIVHGNFSIESHGEQSVCGYLLTSVFASEFGKDPSDMNENIFPPELRLVKARCTNSLTGLRIAVFEYPKSFFKTVLLSSAALMTNEGYGTLFQKPPEEAIKPHHNYLTPTVFSDVEWRSKIAGALNELKGYELAFIFLGRLFWIVVNGFGIWGIYSLLRFSNQKEKALFLLLVMVYFIAVTVLSTGFGAGARLRIPITPILFVFTFYGGGLFFKKLIRTQRNKLIHRSIFQY